MRRTRAGRLALASPDPSLRGDIALWPDVDDRYAIELLPAETQPVD